MKPIIATLLIALLTLGSTPYVDPLIESELLHGYEYGTPSIREYELLLSAQADRIETLESENLSLKEELTVSQGIVSAAGRIESLKQQISDLTGARDSIQASVSTIAAATASASTTLSRIKAATARIDTMTQAFTPDMGVVGCRRFDGVSMEPTFDTNSLVCITDHPSYLDAIGVGDIVIGPAGCIQNRHVIHRVVRMLNGHFVLKGDNPLNGEDPCALPRSQIYYKVVGIAKGIYW